MNKHPSKPLKLSKSIIASSVSNCNGLSSDQTLAVAQNISSNVFKNPIDQGCFSALRFQIFINSTNSYDVSLIIDVILILYETHTKNKTTLYSKSQLNKHTHTQQKKKKHPVQRLFNRLSHLQTGGQDSKKGISGKP